MKKRTVVVYDKWLSSLGGGEVVACNLAKILRDRGYKVTLLSGKLVSKEDIVKNLGINLKGVKFDQVWNDEAAIKKKVQGADLFINTSFMDYSYGYAKKNIYYTHFPNKLYDNLRGYISTKYILPTFARFIKPVEFEVGPEARVDRGGRLVYLLGENTSLLFSYLTRQKEYLLRFVIYFEDFYKAILGNLNWNIEGGSVSKNEVFIDHQQNIVKFSLNVVPNSSTLKLKFKTSKDDKVTYSRQNIYLVYAHIIPLKGIGFLIRNLEEQVNRRLRSGVFVNIVKRLNSYQLIITHSEFVKSWIRKYWDKDCLVLYPPVEMVSKTPDIESFKKQKWICSVGRFFTLGHGKKQEIMISAFKRFYDLGFRDWQLHLVGGLGNEPTSLEFAEKLKRDTEGYPVHFHFNASRKEVEDILFKSRIYWHAAGFGENKNPIKMEHFGIAPVEAISQFCIPILFNGGGLPEIITITGFSLKRNTFNNIDELVKNTVHWISTKDKIDWSSIQQKIKQTLSLEAFQKNFIQIIESNFESEINR